MSEQISHLRILARVPSSYGEVSNFFLDPEPGCAMEELPSGSLPAASRPALDEPQCIEPYLLENKGPRCQQAHAHTPSHLQNLMVELDDSAPNFPSELPPIRCYDGAPKAGKCEICKIYFMGGIEEHFASDRHGNIFSNFIQDYDFSRHLSDINFLALCRKHYRVEDLMKWLRDTAERSESTTERRAVMQVGLKLQQQREHDLGLHCNCKHEDNSRRDTPALTSGSVPLPKAPAEPLSVMHEMRVNSATTPTGKPLMSPSRKAEAIESNPERRSRAQKYLDKVIAIVELRVREAQARGQSPPAAVASVEQKHAAVVAKIKELEDNESRQSAEKLPPLFGTEDLRVDEPGERGTKRGRQGAREDKGKKRRS